jgi:hypothetical protein
MSNEEQHIFDELTDVERKLAELKNDARKAKRNDVRDNIGDALDFVQFSMQLPNKTEPL